MDENGRAAFYRLLEERDLIVRNALWPDTCEGLELLNQQFSTIALSDTYNELLQSLVKQSNIPFSHVFSADMFDSYKPNAKVYLRGNGRET